MDAQTLSALMSSACQMRSHLADIRAVVGCLPAPEREGLEERLFSIHATLTEILTLTSK